MPLLMVFKPQPHILVAIRVSIGALTMLHVLEPLSIIVFTVGKGVDAMALTLSVNIIALIALSVAPHPYRWASSR